MHARYYNAQIGRFLSNDPIDSWSRNRPQSWNFYSYVSNSPLGFDDPDGKRQNPVTGQRGVASPAYGVQGAIRTNQSNPKVGRFGPTRTYSNGSVRHHNGVDINASIGTPLFAPEGGTIIRMSTGAEAGNRIDIKTSAGEIVGLVHLNAFTPTLKVGDSIVEGEVVGQAGTTGNQPDPGDRDHDAQQEHVHMFVLNAHGQSTDPEAWLNDPNAPPPVPVP